MIGEPPRNLQNFRKLSSYLNKCEANQGKRTMIYRPHAPKDGDTKYTRTSAEDEDFACMYQSMLITFDFSLYT